MDEKCQYRSSFKIWCAILDRKVNKCLYNFLLSYTSQSRLNTAFEDMLTTSQGICQTRRELFGQLFEELIRKGLKFMSES